MAKIKPDHSVKLMDKSLLERAWKLAETMSKFATNGFKLTSRDKYEKRLATCEPCEFRVKKHCGLCTCWLPVKAAMDIAECDADKWDKTDDV